MKKIRIAIYHPEGIVIYRIVSRGYIKKGDYFLTDRFNSKGHAANLTAANLTIGHLAQEKFAFLLRPVSHDFTRKGQRRIARLPWNAEYRARRKSC
jgi:hypothetical protein